MQVFIPKGRNLYYVKFRYQRKQYFRSLDTDRETVAEKRANHLYKTITSGIWEDAEKLRLKQDYASLGDIADRYLLKTDIRSAKENVNALYRIARAGRGENFDSRTVKVSELNSSMWDLFVESLRIKARERQLEGDEWALRRVAITANSALRMARSIFSKKMLSVYKDLKLPLKVPFEGILLLPEPDVRYQPLTQDKVVKMEEAAKLLKEENSALWLAYILLSRLGMRNSEIKAAKWNWIVDGSNGPVMAVIERADFRPKAKERFIPIAPTLLVEMEKFKRKPEDHIIDSLTDSQREVIIYRGLSAFVKRFLGEDRRSVKTAYELRKHVGSIIATRDGMMAAQDYLGHSTPATTAKYYATLLKPIQPVEAL